MDDEAPTIAELEARLASASEAPVDPEKRVDALSELAWALRNADMDRAGALADEARELARTHGYRLGEARAARAQTMTIRDASDVAQVFTLAQEAKDLFDEVGEAAGRAATRDFLASIYEHVGDMTGALELALDALAIARESKDSVRQGYALSSVGGVLAATGEVAKGVERLEEALEIFETIGDPTGTGTICGRLCRILAKAGERSRALTYARRCLEVGEVTKSDYLRCTGWYVMAELEREQGNLEEAERLYRAALDSLASEHVRNIMGADAHLALARLLMDRGALEAAEKELDDLLRRVEGQRVSIVAEAATRDALAELKEQQSDPAAALGHLRKAQAVRAQIAEQQARAKLAQVEAQAAMEAAKRDAEIHKLRFVELHGMQSKLVEAEKMAMLGRLAAGTAHELHTPLGVLRSNAEISASATQSLVTLLQKDGEGGARATKLASVLDSSRKTNEAALDRIAEIADSLGRFTQLDQAERRLFDVREGLESALALLEPSLSETIEVQRRMGDVPEIDGWPRELNLAFLTVLQNAAQAIDGAGVLTVEVSATDEHVVVRVRDTGRGMTDEQVEHLFDVGFSEDDERIKMRLGLSAAYTTMQKHEGSIDVQSAVGQGTTVTFRFPRPQ